MMHWRAYLWGDKESLDGISIKPEYIRNTLSLVDETGDLKVVAGLIPYNPGTYEVFLVPKGGKVSSYEIFRALKKQFLEAAMDPGVNRLIAFVDPMTENGALLAEAVGMKFEAFLPAWWEGESRILLGRVCK